MRRRWLFTVLTVVALVAAGATGGVLAKLRYGGVRVVAAGKPLAPAPQPTPTPTPTPARPSPPPVPLVAWHGPVEGMFFHPLILVPQRAFTDDQLGRGFAHYFVTVREFRAILNSLWRSGWTLVDAHRAAAGTVMVPVGRKPVVLSEDDVNYYDYFAGRGLAKRLVLDPSGNVKAEYADASGVRLTDDDLVPLVDKEVVEHPEFSAQGAKGVLAVTGYEGLFGEKDLTDPGARARVKALVAQMRATGWLIASHTYGHIDMSKDSLATIARDTSRWLALTRDLIGPTDLLIYPFGAPPSAAGRALLRDNGFRIQFDIDVVASRTVVDGVVILSRRHIDGYAFAGQRRALAQFFDVAAVRDPARP